MEKQLIEEAAKQLAIKHAKNKPEKYYAEPFEPHQWVIDAISEALSQPSPLIGIEELKGDFVQWAWGGKRTADQIYDWFSPHLRTSDTQSEAVKLLKEVSETFFPIPDHRNEIEQEDLYKRIFEFFNPPTKDF